MKIYKKLISKSGYSLVELMVVISIMGLVGLGTATLIKNVFELQRIQESKSGLLSFSQSLQAALRNETNWTATINHLSNAAVPELTCQRAGTLPAAFCLNNGAAANFDVYTQGPTLFYQGSVAANGITFAGGACNTYPSIACPFRINLSIVNVCTNGEANCAKPQSVITGDLVKAAIDDPVIRKTDDRAAAVGGSISFTLRRGDNVRYEPFEIVELSIASGANGGGACVANSWQTRPLSTILTNTGNNVALAANAFTVQPGTYECTISAEGYDQESGFKIRLTDGVIPLQIGSAITGDLSSATVVGKVEIEPAAATTYTVEHYCSATIASDPNMPAADMGRPLPNYADRSVFTRVYCVRTL